MRTWMYQCLSRRVMRRFKLVTLSCFLGFGLSACSGGGDDAQEPVEASATAEDGTQADDGLEAEIAAEDDKAGPVEETAGSEAEPAQAAEGAELTSPEAVTSGATAPDEEAVDGKVSEAFASAGAEDSSAVEAELSDGAAGVPATTTNEAAAPAMEAAQPIATTPAASTNSTASFAGSEGTYIVQPGDSLAGISSKIYGHKDAWQDLAKINHIKMPFVIFPGNKLKFSTSTTESQAFATHYEQIPEKTVTVKKGDTLSKIATKVFGAPSGWKIFMVYNKIDNPNRIEVGLTLSYKDPRMMANHLSKTKTNKKAGGQAH